MILKHRLKADDTHPEIEVIKNYGDLPKIECYAGQLNQVFMNLLSNAIDTFDESNKGESYQNIAHKIMIATDYRSDFYSLGVTFYQLLTGKLSFISQYPMELVHCHLAKLPIPAHQINP